MVPSLIRQQDSPHNAVNGCNCAATLFGVCCTGLFAASLQPMRAAALLVLLQLIVHVTGGQLLYTCRQLVRPCCTPGAITLALLLCRRTAWLFTRAGAARLSKEVTAPEPDHPRCVDAAAACNVQCAKALYQLAGPLELASQWTDHIVVPLQGGDHQLASQVPDLHVPQCLPFHSDVSSTTLPSKKALLITFVLCTIRRAQVYHNFLTPEECDHIVSVARPMVRRL